MYQFIKLQYQMGRITKEQVFGFAPKYITEVEAETIIGGV